MSPLETRVGQVLIDASPITGGAKALLARGGHRPCAIFIVGDARVTMQDRADQGYVVINTVGENPIELDHFDVLDGKPVEKKLGSGEIETTFRFTRSRS